MIQNLLDFFFVQRLTYDQIKVRRVIYAWIAVARLHHHVATLNLEQVLVVADLVPGFRAVLNGHALVGDHDAIVDVPLAF